MMECKLSILIVSYNVRELLYKCILSILKYEKNVDLEILVFENASEDGSLAMLKKLSNEYSNVHVTESKSNEGFARGNNKLIPKTASDYILLLNPDTEIYQDNSIGRLVEYLEQHPKVGIIGPKIIYGNGKLQYSCGKMPTILNTTLGVLSLSNLFPYIFGRNRYGNWAHDETREVVWVSGACLLIRGNEMRQLKGFDHELIMYAEDVDLCLRIREIGFQVMYYPHVVIKHFEGQSSKKARKASLMAGFKSYIHFYKKYKGRHQALILRYALIAASVVKVCVLAIMSIFSKKYFNIMQSYCSAIPQLWSFRI